MKAILALAALLVASPAAAQVLDGFGLIMPPDRYDSGPTVWPVAVQYMATDKLKEACSSVDRAAAAGITITEWGCTVPGPVVCHIMLPKTPPWNEPPVAQQHVLQHEMAHCRGWPGDHPD